MRCRKTRYYSDLRLVGKPLKTAEGEFLEVPKMNVRDPFVFMIKWFGGNECVSTDEK